MYINRQLINNLLSIRSTDTNIINNRPIMLLVTRDVAFN